MFTALFVRHGQASAFGGAGDYDQLSPLGAEQSERLGEWLTRQRARAGAVYVGPRKRHAQTFESVARVFQANGTGAIPVKAVPELDEHEGMNLVLKQLPRLAAEDPSLRAIVEAAVRGETPPEPDLLAAFRRVARRWIRGELTDAEVETWGAFRARVARAMASIEPPPSGDSVLVFTSAGVIAAALGAVLELRDEKVLDLSVATYNGSLTRFDVTPDGWELCAFNAVPHLPEARLLTRL